MSWLDKYFVGVLFIQANGSALPQRSTLNLAAGLTTTDDPTNDRINVAASAGGLSVSGTGFAHVTSGAFDTAARAVALNSSDVTGNLAISHLAPGSNGTELITNGSGATQWVPQGSAPTNIITITTPGTYAAVPGGEYYLDLFTIGGNVIFTTAGIGEGQGFFVKLIDPTSSGTGGHTCTIQPIVAGNHIEDQNNPGELTSSYVLSQVGQSVAPESNDGTNLWT